MKTLAAAGVKKKKGRRGKSSYKILSLSVLFDAKAAPLHNHESPDEKEFKDE